MPDIDKINLVSVDSIEKLNSILKANIASVNGLIMVSGVGEPAAAYSMRLLGEEVGISSYTGPAIRVRRTGDDVEADVAFDSGEITLSSAISNTTASETTFGDFVGHGGTPVDAFVDTWYDQSSNANHAEQDVPSSQPQIYDATNGLITENGKPALDFPSVFMTNSNSRTITAYTSFNALSIDGSTTNSRIPGFLPTAANDYLNQYIPFTIVGSNISTYVDNSNQGAIAYTAAQQMLTVSNNIGSVLTNYKNGTGTTPYSITQTLNQSVQGDKIGGGPSPQGSFDGRMQELVIYDSDQSSNRTSIETNINDHFLIDNFPSPTSGLLGTYTDAAAAYSVRKLANTASKSMRILVDSDANGPDGSDPTYDIGFNADGSLDVAAIEAYCNNPSGTNYDAYVVTWYDQSGEGNHATQSTFTSCPKIANAGVVITENGKPIISRVSSSTGFEATAVDMSGSTISVSSVSLATANTSIMVWFGALNERLYTGTPGSTLTDGGEGGLPSASPELFWNGSSQGTSATRGEVYTQFYQNQTLASWVGLTSLEGTQFNLSHNVGYWQMHNMQEIIFWESDQSDNRPAIEENINSEYLIYQPTDAPTSGLLATYTGAAAAYSVRQLSDKAVIAMRIRRDSDNEERNIGFDANGDLDSQAISDFCGTANGYVTRWADQSTNGNHAEQDAFASQPQIYDGTEVVTENGKPVIKAQNGTIKLTTPLSTGVNDQTIFSVNRLDRTGVFWGTNDSSSVYFLAAESGSGSTSIQGGFTNVEMRKNGSTYSLTAKTRGNLFTDFQSQHLMTVEFDQSSAGTFQQLGYWTSPDTTFAMWSTQEVIIYASANKPSTTERAAIETNINDYYQIPGM